MTTTRFTWFSSGLLAVASWLVVFWTTAAAEPTTLPAPLADQADCHDQQIEQLIEHLGDKEYFARQRAQAELAKFGFEAFDALSEATSHEDLEIAARARYLLRLMRVQWTAKSDPAEVKRLLADYEAQPMAVQHSRMRELADLPEGAGLAALCRLVRYEKSSVSSKHAAVQLLRRGPTETPPSQELVETVQKSLGRSNRTAVKWLLVWLRFGDDPKAALDEWAKLIDAEQTQLQSAPSETSPELVVALIRFQVGWLKKLGATDQAEASMRRLIDLQDGDLQSLAELLDWLVDQKAWKMVENLARRFRREFHENAFLLYSLAQSYAEEGDKARAETTAKEARQLSPGKEPEQLLLHYVTATELQRRGSFAWAEQEYRHVIANGPADHPLMAYAYFGLSEMFHDQADDLQAAKLLEDLLKIAAKEKPAEHEIAGRPVLEVRSRMHYFWAAHFQSQNDLDRRREHLLEALGDADEVDIDALIACYQCPGLPPEKRQQAIDLIKKTAADLQDEIADDPKNATTYNQFAWLIGNTEGDLDLALKYSKKSIELSPENGGYFDTLAHVYFTKGDYATAVSTQTRAAELDPHSGLILRELKTFRAKLPAQQPTARPTSS